jgi:hypothetical protein
VSARTVGTAWSQPGEMPDAVKEELVFGRSQDAHRTDFPVNLCFADYKLLWRVGTWLAIAAGDALRKAVNRHKIRPLTALVLQSAR